MSQPFSPIAEVAPPEYIPYDIPPSFDWGMEHENINSFEEADKPLNSGENAVHVKTINDHLEGKTHPETNVLFKRKQVEIPTHEGVFPEFESTYDVNLPRDMYRESDWHHEKYCNEKLSDTVEKDPELRKKFNETQLEQIKNGETTDGYAWHHHEEPGKMQLVDEEIHAATGHTGGRELWGGGNDNR